MTNPELPPPSPGLVLFDLSALERAFASNQFDQEELLTLLIGHARRAKPQQSIAALSQIMAFGRTALQASGAVAKGTLTENPDGSVSRSTTVVTRTAALGAYRPPAALPHARVIAAESVAQSTDPVVGPGPLPGTPPGQPADGPTRPADRP